MSAHQSAFANLRARIAARRAVRRELRLRDRYLAECGSPAAYQELLTILTHREPAVTVEPGPKAASPRLARRARRELRHAGL